MEGDDRETTAAAQESASLTRFDRRGHDRDEEAPRRRRDAGNDDARGWWAVLARPTEIASVVGLGSLLFVGTLAMLGYRRDPPADAIARNSAAIDTLKHRVDSLSDRLLFTNYMQCLQAHSPGAAPLSPRDEATCMAIIQRRLSP